MLDQWATVLAGTNCMISMSQILGHSVGAKTREVFHERDVQSTQGTTGVLADRAFRTAQARVRERKHPRGPSPSCLQPICIASYPAFTQQKPSHGAQAYQIQQMPNVNGRQQIRVVAAGGAVVGSVDLESVTGGAVRLSNLVVGEPYRKQGLGGRLVNSALQAARSRGIASVQLEARPHAPSIPPDALTSLYSNAGFRPVARTASGSPVMEAGRSAFQSQSTILRKAAPNRPATVVQRAWKKPLHSSTATTKTLTGADFPALSPTSPVSTTPIALSVPTHFAKWVAKPVEGKAQEPTDNLAPIKEKIKAWDRQSHQGIKATLTETEITDLTERAASVPSKSGSSTVFNVLRGEGSGAFAGKVQLKIIAKFGPTLSGDKQPTYHITLKT
jgi:ribosomal protein S18 acetylase RimI-like enzyme